MSKEIMSTEDNTLKTAKQFLYESEDKIVEAMELYAQHFANIQIKEWEEVANAWIKEADLRAKEHDLANAQLAEKNKRIAELKEALSNVWELWESMAECGQLSIGPQFSANYKKHKEQIEQLLK